MIGIPLAIAYQNFGEWVVHKYILHGRGKKKGSFWNFHFFDHHRQARTNDMHDPDYHQSVLGWHPQGKEAVALTLGTLAVLPLFPVAPFFVTTYVICNLRYYHLHKKAHLDPEWARVHLPWHYDHHMGPNQDANWCVTNPWFDDLMGTRIPYVGTEKELKDRARRQAALAKKQAANAEPEQLAAK
jgi:sterol desaturase/sphingolipid hydroxylase (fatty acid hydroxylase superfamily)